MRGWGRNATVTNNKNKLDGCGCGCPIRNNSVSHGCQREVSSDANTKAGFFTLVYTKDEATLLGGFMANNTIAVKTESIQKELLRLHKI